MRIGLILGGGGQNDEANTQAMQQWCSIFQSIQYNIDGIRWNFKEGEREVKTEDSSWP